MGNARLMAQNDTQEYIKLAFALRNLCAMLKYKGTTIGTKGDDTGLIGRWHAFLYLIFLSRLLGFRTGLAELTGLNRCFCFSMCQRVILWDETADRKGADTDSINRKRKDVGN